MLFFFLCWCFEWHRRYRLQVRHIFILLKPHILAVFGPRSLNIAWDLLNQTDLDRDFLKRYVDLSFEERYRPFLAHFNFVSTWYEWFKKLGQRTALKTHSISNSFFVMLGTQLGNRIWYYYAKKTGKQDAKRFFELNRAKAEKMAV